MYGYTETDPRLTPKPTATQIAATTHDWRNDPATEAQIRYMVTLGIEVEDGLTKGRASELIDAAKSADLGMANGFYQDGSN
jgi:hypothetical protein